MKYSTRIATIFLMNLSLFFNLNAASYSYLESEPPSIELKERSHIFIESGSESMGMRSSYVFIIPKDDYILLRSDNGKYSTATLVVIESLNIEKIIKRYHNDQGFAFFRITNDDLIHADTETKETIVDNIADILNHEANDKGVYFYDFKDSFSFNKAFDVFCEGKIFSPSRGSAHGYFFFKKLKPGYGREACYLIYTDMLESFIPKGVRRWEVIASFHVCPVTLSITMAAKTYI